MSPYRNRLKTPEEIELGKKREELARVRQTLSEWESAYNALKSDIRKFEQLYERVLGARIAELEDLEWQLGGLLEAGGFAPAKDTPRQEETFTLHHRTDLLDEELDVMPDNRHKTLKSLYRGVAKAIHPDLASDDDERKRRQELMTVANQAYAEGDRRVLEDILNEWEQEAEPVSGMDVAMELVRVIRLIFRANQDMHAIIRHMDELKATDIYAFKLRVNDAHAEGIDLMAEMAASVDLDIAKTRKRLAVLRGDSEGLNATSGTPLETRLIKFPVDHTCGTLYERSTGSVDYREWHRVGSARGVREVFLDKALRLDVKGSGGTELNFLASLQPDDLQALFLYDVDDSSLVHLKHLTGLQELYLSNTTISDKGLKQLAQLNGLRRLYIYHTAISDTGLLNLAKLKQLKWLTCSGTEVTEAGLAAFRKQLPECKAVNFQWRYEK